MANDGGLKGRKDNSKRRFEGGGSRPDRNVDKRLAAAERQADWAALSLKEQLEDLDARLGKGVGAVKQRAKIAAGLAGPRSKGTVGQKSVAPAAPPKVKAKDRRAAEQLTARSKLHHPPKGGHAPIAQW